PCQPKIGEMRVAFHIKQYVSGLDIPVKNSALMCMVHRACQLRYEFRRCPAGHRLAFDNLIQLSAFNQLHAEVTGTVAFSDFMDRNNEWMVQPCGSLGLEPKTLHMSLRRPVTKANDF